MEFIKSIIRPTKGRNGFVYTVFLLALLYLTFPVVITLGIIFGIYKIWCHFDTENTRRKGREYLTNLRQELKTKYDTDYKQVFMDVEAEVSNLSEEMARTGVLRYQLVSYKDNGSLTRYVRFVDTSEHGFRNITPVVISLLAKYKKVLNSYQGKSKKLRDTILLVDLDQINLEKDLEKIAGRKVELKQIEYVDIVNAY